MDTLPIGHYTNMITAIRDMAAANEAKRKAIADAAANNKERRRIAHEKMQSDQKLQASVRQGAA